MLFNIIWVAVIILDIVLTVFNKEDDNKRGHIIKVVGINLSCLVVAVMLRTFNPANAETLKSPNSAVETETSENSEDTGTNGSGTPEEPAKKSNFAITVTSEYKNEQIRHTEYDVLAANNGRNYTFTVRIVKDPKDCYKHLDGDIRNYSYPVRFYFSPIVVDTDLFDWAIENNGRDVQAIDSYNDGKTRLDISYLDSYQSNSSFGDQFTVTITPKGDIVEDTTVIIFNQDFVIPATSRNKQG